MLNFLYWCFKCMFYKKFYVEKALKIHIWILFEVGIFIWRFLSFYWKRTNRIVISYKIVEIFHFEYFYSKVFVIKILLILRKFDITLLWSQKRPSHVKLYQSKMLSFDQIDKDWTFTTVWNFHKFSFTQNLREINF